MPSTTLVQITEAAAATYTKVFDEEMKDLKNLEYDTKLISAKHSDVEWDNDGAFVLLSNDKGVIPAGKAAASELWKAPIGFTRSSTAQIPLLKAWCRSETMEEIAHVQATEVWAALNEKAKFLCATYDDLVAKGEMPKVDLDKDALRFIKVSDLYTLPTIKAVDDTLVITGQILFGLALYPGPAEANHASPAVI